jgi:hypothetical protein
VSCAAPEGVYSTLQRPVLLEMSTLQGPELFLDLSILTRPELLLDVSTLQRPALHLDVSTPQRPELHLDLSTTEVLAASGLVYATEASAKGAGTAPGLVYTAKDCAAHIEVSTLQRTEVL